MRCPGFREVHTQALILKLVSGLPSSGQKRPGSFKHISSVTRCTWGEQGGSAGGGVRCQVEIGRGVRGGRQGGGMAGVPIRFRQ